MSQEDLDKLVEDFQTELAVDILELTAEMAPLGFDYSIKQKRQRKSRKSKQDDWFKVEAELK